MRKQRFTHGRNWVIRLAHDADIVPALESLARQNEIKAARVELIGAVKRAVFGYYDQDQRQYHSIVLPQPMEILSCIGNLTMRDGEPRAHLHIILGDGEGLTRGGHLMPGTIIFAGEAIIEELRGVDLQREHDPQTGLPLWKGSDLDI